MNSQLKNFFLIAESTFKEIYRTKILLYVSLIGLGIFTITYIASNLTFGIIHQAVLDIGLGTLTITSVGMAIFIGGNLVKNEIEQRTIYMILSRPINRTTFFLGKMTGIIGILLINMLILSTLTIAFYTHLGGKLNKLIIYALGMNFLEAVIVLLLANLFSLFTNNILACLNTLVVFVVGHSYEQIGHSVVVKNSSLFSGMHQLLSFAVPNFSKINIKDYVLFEQYLPGSFVFQGMTYGILYSSVVLILSCLIFSKIDLD